MKYERYAVEYSVTTHHEAILTAHNTTQAIKKVIEVIGEPVIIGSVYRLKPKNKNEG